jgi:hypothetical protein
LYSEAIHSFLAGFEFDKKGGYPFQIAQCYEALSENFITLKYYIQSAEISKEDPEVGPEAASTIESVKNAMRLAQELGKINDLPEWFKK